LCGGCLRARRVCVGGVAVRGWIDWIVADEVGEVVAA
jgi:hypothetical protein